MPGLLSTRPPRLKVSAVDRSRSGRHSPSRPFTTLVLGGVLLPPSPPTSNPVTLSRSGRHSPSRPFTTLVLGGVLLPPSPPTSKNGHALSTTPPSATVAGVGQL